MIPDLKNGYFQTMTNMIVSDTHNYDLVANVKLILHVKKIDQNSVYTSEIFLMTFAAIRFYIWLRNPFLFFSIFLLKRMGLILYT